MMISVAQIAHSRRRFPAWLGIFAILMLFIAPVISKTMVSEGMPVPVMAGMDMSSMVMPTMPMHHMSGADHPAQHASAQVSPSQDSHSSSLPAMSPADMMDAACGYCVLLMHMPLLVLLAIPLLWSFAVIVRPSFPRPRLCLIPVPLLCNAQPRAPPASVLVFTL